MELLLRRMIFAEILLLLQYILRSRLYRKKTNIKIDDVEDTIDYRQFSYYEFDYLASFPLLDTDKITMLNVPLQVSHKIYKALKALSYTFREHSNLWRKLLRKCHSWKRVGNVPFKQNPYSMK